MAQMSIGYDAIRATRDTKGIRHLLEVGLWEGSVVTTGYAANPQAVITGTKTRRISVDAFALAHEQRAVTFAAVDGLLAEFADGVRNPVLPGGMRLTGYVAKRYEVMQTLERERTHDPRPGDSAALAVRAGWQRRETLRRAEEANWQ